MGSRRSNPSVKLVQKNPIDSNTIRSSSLRDYTPSRAIFAVDLCIARKRDGRAHLLDRPCERACTDLCLGRRSAASYLPVQLRPIDAKISARILKFHHDNPLKGVTAGDAL